MLLRNIYNTDLAQASYLVGCQRTGEALVVDPNRDIDAYIELATREGLTITAITETHIHADFLSGAKELAERTGATLYLSDEGTDDWKYAFASDAGAVLLRDGDSFKVGNVQIKAIHTPGHTPEHMVFLLTDAANADRPMGIFTGDFVFVGDVGRPDLLERAAGFSGTMEAGARNLFDSLQAFKELPDFVQVWPGHGAGSACGKALGAVPQSTVGYEKLFNWALQITERETFVDEVLAGQPEPPTYFAQMKRLNKEGARATTALEYPGRAQVEDLEAALEDGMTIVDVRGKEAFAAGHIPGTVHIPAGSSFLTWAGWLVSYDRPFGLIVDEGAVNDIVRLLRMIGLDDVAAYWTPDIVLEWVRRYTVLSQMDCISVETFNERYPQGNVTILDVRGATEYVEGHIPGSLHIPAGHLSRRIDEIPADEPVIVHCQSGIRSAIATSVLLAHGRQNVVDLKGGFEAWVKAGLPVERGAGMVAKETVTA
jgi:hydroxyacylglutathione hydrolase